MRFQMSLSPFWSPLLATLGATRQTSYVEVDDDTVHFRFGFFDRSVPLSDIEAASVKLRQVPWYRTSIGWRTNFAGKLGLMGSRKNVVGITLKTPFSAFIGLPVSVKEVFVTLEEPDQFVEALRLRLARA